MAGVHVPTAQESPQIYEIEMGLADHGHSHGDHDADLFRDLHGHGHDVLDHDHSTAVLKHAARAQFTAPKDVAEVFYSARHPRLIYRIDRPPRA